MSFEEMTEKIINYIAENHVTTTEVGDCLQKTGAVHGAKPLNRGHFCVGRVEYIYAHSNTNWPIHEQLKDIPTNRVIFVDQFDVENRALFGELVCMYMREKKQACAIVTRGLLRDAPELISGDYPVWCGGITPEGCFNIDRVETPEISLAAKRAREYYQDAIAVCDDCGVVIIPKEHITEEMYQKLIKIEETERTWFHCVRDLGWDTFDTVCLKKYEK